MIYTINILFSSKNYLYITILTIQSLGFIFLVHFKEHLFNELPLVDNNVFSNFIFFIFLFLGINGIATYINHQKDKKYLKNKAKLFKSNKSIKKLNSEIEQLNVAALHSLKTPIYVANDFIKKLHTNCISGIHQENEYEYEELIINSITLSQMYVENLTTYTKIITETNAKTRFNILEKITFITNIVTKKFEAATIRITCDDFYVTANDFCFIIILENLLTNGLKYNNNVEKKIDILVTKSEFEVKILVSDNGIGIDPIYFDRIFSPFVRIQQRIQIEGTGLGLSSVKMAARKMNGNVRIISSSSLGTTFEFTFKNI
ncbi:sensor histidine kinase [Flavobacterium sp. 20NA77.7]|uniref:histidine kinase n=1 Tax=Flavobacterium nakdongensis TaxID=3073563 RepID=A0ABY9R9D5_9FLAO|nr:sensor histidine kinase [Flavobacterium sp. 20NA77.7]WMW77389.1 sensor histidine kinase [Flavobacterium sp. 20NA77.7]